MASAATVMVHGAAIAVLIMNPQAKRPAPPPVYRVELVAAPAPEPNARQAPEVMQRPAAPAATVPKKATPPSKTIAKAPPPRTATPEVKREPAPRTTAPEAPVPGVTPSTGTDVATVKTTGVEFPYPDYLRNMMAQIYRRWQRPTDNVMLKAEVLFFVHRDGSVSNVQFVKRSGNFAFDLEAQGAIEATANAGAFGRLPEGFPADLLPVSFFFNPGDLR